MMLRHLCSTLAFVFLAVWLGAQPRESGFVFKASDLMQVSQKVAGDSAAWPLVVGLSERYLIRNEFRLPASAQKALKPFAELRRKVNLERQTLSQLIKRGAPVLAEAEFSAASAALQAHDKAVSDGKLEPALSAGEKFLSLLPELSSTVEARRTEAIEAKLKKKAGTVDKRKGLLGVWQPASEGDLLAESDGIRTAAQSSALLAFVDGSTLFVSENTTAIVRTARIDRLDKTLRADVVLVKGTLLSQLSAQAQEAGMFKLNAGSSEAIVNSGKFWASVSDARIVRIARIANYDGTMQVQAGKMLVTLQKNQGTVVLQGKEPLPPVELLPAPRLRWNGLDTVIFRNELTLQWNPVPSAAKYHIEVSPESDFSRHVKAYFTTALSLQLKNLPHETHFVRLQAIDRLGLRGADSPTYRILRSPDTEPPFLFVQDFPTQLGDTLLRYTTLNRLTLRGESEPNSTLLKDGELLTTMPNGTFEFTVQLDTLAEKLVQLSALNAAQNRRNLVLRIKRIRIEQLRELSWSCIVNTDTLLSKGLPIQVRGLAYPNLTLHLTHSGKIYSAIADSKGNWAISVEPTPNQTLTVSFESPDSKEPIIIRTYFVK
ncbi:MAG: hypothetical protein RML35_15225 [Chloroherpetonaceae bacterium]|nr:hypothetical protein [Chloroherpetonaceae bacterium]